jgi:hypothetical protein
MAGTVEHAEFKRGDRVQDVVYDGRYVGQVVMVVADSVVIRDDLGRERQLLAREVTKIGDR